MEQEILKLVLLLQRLRDEDFGLNQEGKDLINEATDTLSPGMDTETYLRSMARVSLYPTEVCQQFEDLADVVESHNNPTSSPRVPFRSVISAREEAKESLSSLRETVRLRNERR